MEIQPLDERTFLVTVPRITVTRHRVYVDPAYHEYLTKGRIPAETLVRYTFEFLMKREENIGIPRRFNIDILPEQYPDYEYAMWRCCQAA